MRVHLHRRGYLHMDVKPANLLLRDGVPVLAYHTETDRGGPPALADLAVAEGIAHQFEVLPLGGTDAGAIQRSRGGVASVTLSNPSRYVHTVVEMLAKRDLEAAVALLTAFLSTPGAAVPPKA